MQVPLPDKAACARILTDCLKGLGAIYPAIARLVSAPQFAACADACVGLDGRAIRKMVANALATSTKVAMNPGLVTIEDLLAAAKAARESRVQKDVR